MGVVFKHIIKNVFGKPGRTLLVLLCLTISSFVALMTFDMSGAMRNLFTNLYASYFGKTDIIGYGNTENSYKFLEDEEFPENTSAFIYKLDNTYYTRIDGEYDVVEANPITVYSFDFESARDLEFYDSEIELNEFEAIVNESMAEKFGFEVGDTIIVRDVNDIDVEFTVVRIEDMGKGFFSGDTVIISTDSMFALDSAAKPRVVVIDIHDDSVRKSAVELLDEKYPSFTYEYLFENEEIEETINSMSNLFLVLLAVCLMMVIFVTISISDRIVCERMSVIGTLRSLGFTSLSTTIILLLENVTYGLLGGAFGCILYGSLRNPILGLLVTSTSDVTIDFGKINPLGYVIVIAAAIVIEILCSIKETIKAVNIPVRDIIFNTKDTSFKASKGNIIFGLICLVAAVVFLFFKNVFILQILSIGGFELAIAMLSPYAITFIAGRLRIFTEKKGKVIPTLAFGEVETKKNTIGAGVLITTVSTLTILLLAFCQAFQANVSKFEYFEADVMLQVKSGDEVNFRYLNNLPEVTGVEYARGFGDQFLINGEEFKYSTSVYASCPNENGWQGCDIFKGMETDVNENEIVVADDLAEELDLHEGDVVTITFLNEYYFPIEREMTVKGIWDTKQYPYAIEINYELYHDLYGDDISVVYIMTDEPDLVKETAIKYSDAFIYSENCYTHQEYIDYMNSQVSGVLAVIYFVLILGIIITFAGAAGNLLIGFESRKRECAVLLSTSLTRKQLCGVFFRESAIVSAISLIIAYPLGALLIYPLKNAFIAMDTALVMEFNPLPALIVFIIMWIVFTMTAIKPNRALRKMKLAEQLKYE